MIKDFFKTNKKPILIFTIVFFTELLVILILIQINGIGIFFRGDGRDYQNLANNLIYHKTLAITPNLPYLPTSFRTPIYPFWLAFIYLIFRSYNAAVFIGAFIFALSAPLIYFIGREIFTEKIALIAALLSGLEPWALYQSGFLAAEQIFLPIFLLSVYLFICYLKSGATSLLYLSSFILGIAVLTRPVALVFVSIFAFLTFIFEYKFSIRRALKITALTFLIFILTLSPWFIRNKIVLNSWQFSSASGLNIFGNYLMLEKYLGKFGAKDDIYEKAKQLTGAKNDIEAITTVENSKKLTDIAIKGIVSYPGSFLAMHFLNTVPLFFLKSSYGNILFDFGIYTYGLRFFSLLFWPIIMLLVIFGALKQLKQKPSSLSLWLLVLWILYFSILLAGARDISRYKLAINAPLFIFAILGFYLVKDYILRYVRNT